MITVAGRWEMSNDESSCANTNLRVIRYMEGGEIVIIIQKYLCFLNMMIEFRKDNTPAVSQDPIKVIYEEEVVGEYFVDILVDKKVIVEIKATKQLVPDHEAQLLNYLKATDVEVGFLLNFGSEPEIKRKVFDNVRK